VRSQLQDSIEIFDPAYHCDEHLRIPAKRNSPSRLFRSLDLSPAYAHPSIIIRPILLLTLLVFIFPVSLYPQALTPPKGEGYVSLAFEDLFVRDHFLSSGDRIDIGHIRTIGLIQSIEYGVTDHLGASLSLPVIASKYYGPDPHQLPIDDGNYHGSSQDFRIGVQYNVRRRPVILTPFVTVIVPSRDYIFFAHSAVGTHQPELDLGLAAAGHSERWLPNAYYQAAYSYGIVGVVTGVRPNRSHMSLEGGYFVTRYLTLRALADSQLTHGGFDIPQDFNLNISPPDERFRHHDQSANINSLNLGGGFDVALGRRWDIFAALTTTVWGENGHAMRTGLSAGISWSFRTPWARPAQAEMAQPVTTTHTH
jgi:hypothetical protein